MYSSDYHDSTDDTLSLFMAGRKDVQLMSVTHFPKETASGPVSPSPTLPVMSHEH